MTSMRDTFFNKLYDIAKKDRNVILVSADMGAPSLDKYRKDLASQYINVGVAESSMITTAVGLALSGKKVFVYAIIPFAISRCYEFIKLDISLMNTPITITGIGAGCSYNKAGPTHHAIEDISIMRVLPNFEILNCSDNAMAESFAKYAYESDNPVYVRLDRQDFPNKYDSLETFKDGFHELKEGEDVCIVATGNTVQSAMEVSGQIEVITSRKDRKLIGVIDLYRLKPVNVAYLVDCLSKYKYIITWEEHLLAGGLGSILSEIITDHNLPVKLKRIGIDNRYCYIYGSRENIQKQTRIDKDDVFYAIERWYGKR